MRITATRTQESTGELYRNEQTVLSMMNATPASKPAREASLERDMPEVAARFNRPQVAAFGVEALLRTGAPSSDFNTTTYGSVTFRHVSPIAQPKEEVVTLDARLQQKLEVLCESLRSKY